MKKAKKVLVLLFIFLIIALPSYADDWYNDLKYLWKDNNEKAALNFINSQPELYMTSLAQEKVSNLSGAKRLYYIKALNAYINSDVIKTKSAEEQKKLYMIKTMKLQLEKLKELDDLTDEEMKALDVTKDTVDDKEDQIEDQENAENIDGKPSAPAVSVPDPEKRDESQLGDVAGLIQIQRKTADKKIGELKEDINEITKKMLYVEQDKFEQMVAENDVNALNYYTLDKEYNLLVASWSYDSAGDGVKIVKNAPINYKSIMEHYSLPFSYSVAFLLDGQDTTFSRKFAELALNGEVLFEIRDNINTTKTVTTVTAKKQYYMEGENGSYSSYGEGNEYAESQETVITENNTLKAEVTYIDSWFVNFVKKFTYHHQTAGPTEVSNNTETGEMEFDHQQQESKVYSKTSRTTSVESTNITHKYDKGTSEVKGAPDKFADLLNSRKYYAKDKIKSEPIWLIDMIEQDPHTANMSDLTKYLLYYTDHTMDLGVHNFDFSQYDPSKFETVKGAYGNTIQEKVWFGLRALDYTEYAVAGAMGNIHYESGSFDPNAVEGGYNENNGGIGICQWTNNRRGSNGRNTQLRSFAASRGKPWQDPEIQVEFLIAELTPGGGADGYASYQLMNTDNATPEQWIAAPSVEDATRAFCYSFERPSTSAAIASMQKRTEYALMYYNEFQGRTAIGGEFYDIAKQCHDYIREAEYWYPSAANLAAGGYVADGTPITHRLPTIGEPPNQRHVDCSAYVSWVISLYTGSNFLQATGGLMRNDMGFIEVGFDDLQPGDIVVNNNHTEIYAGDGRTFNAGSTNAIRSETSGYRPVFTKAFRAPPK